MASEPDSKPERCDYYWADWDRCGLYRGHAGKHTAYDGPQCEAVEPETGYQCQRVWYHDFEHEHKTVLRWKG